MRELFPGSERIRTALSLALAFVAWLYFVIVASILWLLCSVLYVILWPFRESDY
jgi:hypothetical protein